MDTLSYSVLAQSKDPVHEFIKLVIKVTDEYESDLRSNEYYLGGRENEAQNKGKIQACTGLKPMTFAIPEHCSTN